MAIALGLILIVLFVNALAFGLLELCAGLVIAGQGLIALWEWLWAR